jgi:hypothetical protein
MRCSPRFTQSCGVCSRGGLPVWPALHDARTPPGAPQVWDVPSACWACLQEQCVRAHPSVLEGAAVRYWEGAEPLRTSYVILCISVMNAPLSHKARLLCTPSAKLVVWWWASSQELRLIRTHGCTQTTPTEHLHASSTNSGDKTSPLLQAVVQVDLTRRLSMN